MQVNKRTNQVNAVKYTPSHIVLCSQSFPEVTSYRGFKFELTG